jgi:hypothetical protein
MLETHLEILNVVGKNRFYALTFRKPATDSSRTKAEAQAASSGEGDKREAGAEALL